MARLAPVDCPVTYSSMRRVSPKTVVRQIRHRMILAARYCRTRSSRPRGRVFVLAEPRVGSNLLLDYMRSIPEFSVTEEILNPWSPIGIPRRLVTRSGVFRHMVHSMHRPGTTSVSKLMLHHLRWRGIGPEDLLAGFPEARFVINYRENLVEQYVSTRLLQRSGIDRLRRGAAAPRSERRIVIEAEALQRFCRSMRKRFRQWAEGLPEALTISYEELAAAPQALFEQRVCPYLNVPIHSVETSLVKQNRRPLHEIIDNWADVAPFAQSDEAFLKHVRSGGPAAAAPL